MLLPEASNQGETNKTVHAWVKEHNNGRLTLKLSLKPIAPPRENESEKQKYYDVFRLQGTISFSLQKELARVSWSMVSAKDNAIHKLR